VTARHHDNGKGNEGEKEEYQEQGGHAVPASLLLSLTRPQGTQRAPAPSQPWFRDCTPPKSRHFTL